LEFQLVNVLGNIRLHVWIVDRDRNEFLAVASEVSGPLVKRNLIGLPVILVQSGMVTGGDIGFGGRVGSGALEGTDQIRAIPLTDQNVLGVAVLTRQTSQLADLASVSLAAYPPKDDAIRNGARGVLIQPVVGSGDAVGLLIIDFGFDRPHGFASSEVEFLRAIADLSASALARRGTALE